MVAGALIPLVGLPMLHLLDAIALSAALWAVWRLPDLPPLNGEACRARWRDVLVGFHYLATHKLLLVSFLADIIAMVFGNPRALFPGAGRHWLSRCGQRFRARHAFRGLANRIADRRALSGMYSHIQRHGLMVLLSVGAFGLAIVGFGMSPSLIVAVFFLALARAADMVSMVFRGTILQAAATDEMCGRMQGVHTVVVTGGPRIADLLHGLAAPVAGASVTVAAGGGLVVVFAIALVLAVPAFIHYRASVKV